MLKSQNLGIYIHIPFCKNKCPYCDFYSIIPIGNIMDNYLDALKNEILYDNRINTFVTNNVYSKKVDTIYFGGGTPSFFGAKRICELIDCLKTRFELAKNVEITIEANPSSCSQELFLELAQGGVNRLSLGLQSACANERAILGRLSDINTVENAVTQARFANIENISLDLMLGTPKSSLDNLKKSIDFCLKLNVPHISAYMLKIEQGTPFADADDLIFADEDEVCEMYLFLCEQLEANGIPQYEISNFSRKGFESRHNLKYWNCENYLGFGPSAHSFIDGKRFFFERNINAFIDGKKAIYDSEGGSFEEYAMLRLRLKDGLSSDKTQKRFGHALPESMLKKASMLEKSGFLTIKDDTIILNPKGFLISNIILNNLLCEE